MNDHRQQFDKARQPLLEGLTSSYDLELFLSAQTKASEVMVSLLIFVSTSDYNLAWMLPSPGN